MWLEFFLYMCLFLLNTELVKVVLTLDKEIKRLAEKLYQYKSILVMGHGFNYATCLEGALVSLINALFVIYSFVSVL